MTPIQVSQATGHASIKQEPTDSTTQINVLCLLCSFRKYFKRFFF